MNWLAGGADASPAVAKLRRRIDNNPADAEAWFYLANELVAQARFGNAVFAYEQTIRLNPNVASAHNNLSVALRRLDQIDLAIAASRRAIAIDPQFIDAHANLGGLLHEAGDFPAARAELQIALALNPTLAAARGSLGLILLLEGDLSAGWELYEERLSLRERYRGSPGPFPVWDGRALDGQFIFLRCEQGFGDSIQFVRYAPMVAARGGKVIIGGPPELKRLLTTAPGVHAVIAPGDPLPQCAAQCLLMSLPRLFDTVLETIPASPQYLFADPADIARWGARFKGAAAGATRRVGLAWAGAAHNKHDQRRSIALRDWGRLANVPGVQLFSLQKGIAAEQVATSGLPIVDWAGELSDFADTAALVSNLDLVITVDTAVAHLAGALGKPVWVLIHYSPDWRWLLNRGDSPWYPSMRLFRQPKPGDWASAIADIERALRD